jgi:hypothetical protein
MDFESTMNTAFGQLATAFAGAIDMWLAVTVLASLIVVAAFRPERIVDAGSFRAAIRRFGLYLVVPSFVALVAVFSNKSEVITFLVSLSLVVGRLLLALTVMSLLGSLFTSRDRT